MGNYTKINDLVTGNEGSAYINIDGENRYFFEVSKVDANIEFTVASKRLLGSRMKQHKVVNAEGKGTLSIYRVSPAALEIYKRYVNEGRTPEISIQTVSEDAASTVGRQTVVMRHCLLSKVPVAYLDDEAEDLARSEIDFTFDAVDNLENYKFPENMR